jgi:prephenate dehydrogenase
MKKYALGVVGTGLIGGSMAIDLRRRGFAGSVLGVEADPVAAAAAEKLGIVDRVVPLEECVRESDIILVAVPVSAAIVVIGSVLDLFEKEGYADKIVMDVCSTKSQIAERLKYHPYRKRYVATHPMAGTEHSGPWAALPGLFDARACIIADQDESDPAAVRAVEELYKVLNMRIVYMTSDSHDVHTAFVSHLSHVTSFALALTVLDKERDEKHIFDLASGGFSSTVRLAKSNADMWVPIFMQNRDNLLRVIDAYMEKMQEFREAIDQYDEDKVRALIDEANRIKKIIR